MKSTKLFNVLVSIMCCSVMVAEPALATISATINGAAVARRTQATTDDGLQMAEILGVRPQVERLHGLVEAGDSNSDAEQLALRSQILHKSLNGYVEVRRSYDRIFRELSFTFNVMYREQRKQELIDQAFNLANFAQLGSLYTCEPFLRLHKQFKASAICTTTGGGLGLTLPTLNILQHKFASVKNIEPPPAMQYLVMGGPVDATNLPLYVDRYLNTAAPGTSLTRKETMFAEWKKRYNIDASNPANLCSLHTEGKPRKMGLLRSRILLLFSLQTYIQQMDESLLSMLRLIDPKPTTRIDSNPAADANLVAQGLNASAADAARLLQIESQVTQLQRARNSGANLTPQQQGTEGLVLERLLIGALEVRTAVDQVDAEINYASDVVLSELLAKRARALQRNFEVNFIQAGTFGSCAGLLYLKGYGKAGNEMFVISGGIGTVLSTLALRLMRGGSRRIDTEPNALADIFDYRQRGEYSFSPMISAYLNSPAPNSTTGHTRRQELFDYWKANKATTVNIENEKNRKDLAAMPDADNDRIKIVTNRITMLHAVLTTLESLDSELALLLQATDSKQSLERINGSASPVVNATLTPQASEVENLMKVQHQISTVAANPNDSAQRLALVRQFFTTVLDVRSTEDALDTEIATEWDVLRRMTRARDKVVSMTNNLNFYQLNILAIVIDGILGLSAKKENIHAANDLNIVSGLMVASLAAATVVEQHGGHRPLPAKPNMLGPCLAVNSPERDRYATIVWQYINNVPPNVTGPETRIQRMELAWKQSKTVYVNVDKQSIKEKVSAYGPAHTKHSESIKLIKNRLNMLYDLEGLVGGIHEGIDDLMLTAG